MYIVFALDSGFIKAVQHILTPRIEAACTLAVYWTELGIHNHQWKYERGCGKNGIKTT